MKIGIARIYYGGGRRYLTLRGACQAEAKARAKERKPGRRREIPTLPTLHSVG